MDKFNFDVKLNNYEKNEVLYKKIVLGQLILNIILVIWLIVAYAHEKIILVPEVAPEDKIWVTNSQVSNEYLNTIGRNVMDLLLNVTPEDVDSQHKELLGMVASKYRPVLMPKLAELAKNIKENNISQNFYIDSIRIIQDSGVVYVNGELREYIDNTLSHSTTQIYRLNFKVQNYRTVLQGFELVPADDPQLKDLQNAKTN